MEPELFLLKMSEHEECKSNMYKCLTIHEYMSFHYMKKSNLKDIDTCMIPYGKVIEQELHKGEVDIDELFRYMLENDKTGYILFSLLSKINKKESLLDIDFLSQIEKNKILTPYVEKVDLEAVALIVMSFVFDNLSPRKFDISEIVQEEIFVYQTNSYKLTKVNGAIFKMDGLIFDGKGYYYNYFTNKTIMNPMDTMPGFAKIIQESASKCDVFYRLDERLSMPESEYYDYTGVAFGKFYGPQFNFNKSVFKDSKTIIVHMDMESQDKLLMVVKQRTEQETGKEFWHIELETLPYRDLDDGNVITTFLHGMYYPQKDVFTHIDYTKNQHSGEVYFRKYMDIKTGTPIDQYTEDNDLHYKIWCIENGEFTRDMWYKLMIISLSTRYQNLFNKMLE